jgi:hypothetical protein
MTNVHQRLAAVMAEVTYIQKERKQGMNYTIVSHDAVTAKVRPVLLKHGIVYYPVRCEYSHNGNRAECAMTVRFVNVDQPTDFFDVPTFGYGVDPQDKGPGKAMSYAVKYALLKAFGLETGDDPDTDNVDYTPADPALPKPAPQEPARDPKAIADGLIAAFAKAETVEKLKAGTADGTKAATAWDWLEIEAKDQSARVRQAFDARKAELQQKEAA